MQIVLLTLSSVPLGLTARQVLAQMQTSKIVVPVSTALRGPPSEFPAHLVSIAIWQRWLLLIRPKSVKLAISALARPRR